MSFGGNRIDVKMEFFDVILNKKGVDFWAVAS